MKKVKFGLAALCLTMLLDGCASAIGNANAGPDPGGGFYDGPNINVGHINPEGGSFSYGAYTNVSQARP
jgi:hypothetical protein